MASSRNVIDQSDIPNLDGESPYIDSEHQLVIECECGYNAGTAPVNKIIEWLATVNIPGIHKIKIID